MGNSIRRAGGYRIVLADAFNFVKESYEALSAMAEVVRARKAPLMKPLIRPLVKNLSEKANL